MGHKRQHLGFHAGREEAEAVSRALVLVGFSEGGEATATSDTSRQ
eukprot:NODE_16101_length_315_cov_3.030075_g14935_i0.p4 GENE.NODE_16101_length_315_cov_3.030075_g14935_i0~~NODE_16101_length_315_cov_3.030075_g14935_i0.p4  ORF type:complete len:55 (-),score=0.86 NODE_16101_length_315_cov_3.030075_g14935_i0:150-284(-)